MPEKRQYRISNLNIEQINFIFNLLANRLDEIEGWRGSPEFRADIDMQGFQIRNLANGSLSTDAISKDQLDTLGIAKQDAHTRISFTSGGGIQIIDTNDEVIHQIGPS